MNHCASRALPPSPASKTAIRTTLLAGVTACLAACASSDDGTSGSAIEPAAAPTPTGMQVSNPDSTLGGAAASGTQPGAAGPTASAPAPVQPGASGGGEAMSPAPSQPTVGVGMPTPDPDDIPGETTEPEAPSGEPGSGGTDGADGGGGSTNDSGDDTTTDAEAPDETEPPGETDSPPDGEAEGPDPMVDVTPPVDVSELSALACGAKYTALGDGGWKFCARLADGGGACTQSGSAAFERVTFAGGAPVSDVAQVSGFGDGSIAVVTQSGALLAGPTVTSIAEEPLIPTGVVNFSGGYHSRVALVKNGGSFGVLAWADAGTPSAVQLPGNVEPVQVSGNYGLACALGSDGGVYCWDAGGNHGLSLGASPSPIELGKPVRLISVGQNSVCGVSFDSTLECIAAWYDNPFLPTEGTAPDFRVRQSTFPEVREVHAGFRQGIVVRGDGVAFFLEGNGAGEDNPGSEFTGATDVIASGGDRGNACVQTAAGAVYCMVGGASVQATVDGMPLQAAAASCPF